MSCEERGFVVRCLAVYRNCRNCPIASSCGRHRRRRGERESSHVRARVTTQRRCGVVVGFRSASRHAQSRLVRKERWNKVGRRGSEACVRARSKESLRSFQLSLRKLVCVESERERKWTRAVRVSGERARAQAGTRGARWDARHQARKRRTMCRHLSQWLTTNAPHLER